MLSRKVRVTAWINYLSVFLHYVSLDTQSKSGVRQVPSTEGQWKLLRLLKQQLEEMGLVNITLSEKGR